MNLLVYIARGFMSLIFIAAGLEKIIDWERNLSNLSMTFSKWRLYLEGLSITSDVYGFLVSSATFIMGITIFLELVGGSLLFIGFHVRFAAFLLLLFLIPHTLFYHPFWLEIGDTMYQEAGFFLKNLALIGALLYLLAEPKPEKAC